MPDDPLKGFPGGMPAIATGVDELRFSKIAYDDETVSRAHLQLSIHGGVAGERFELDLTASGDGRMTCALECEMSGRKIETTETRLEPRRFAEIIRNLNLPRLAASSTRQSGFPPCSLIGRLKVEVDDDRLTMLFMADAEQAKTAGYEPPAEVTRAVEMLLAEAQKRLGVEYIGP